MTQILSRNRTLKRRFVCATWLAIASIGSGCAALSTAHGQTPETEYALAAGFYGRSQWSQSADAFKAFIADHPHAPQSSAAQFFLGEAYVQQNNFESAYPAYQQYLNENPRAEFSSRAAFRLGECAYRTGNTKAALRFLESFVADHPKHELIEFALPYLGELRLARSEPQLAQATFETALKYYPGSALSNQSRLGLAKSLQAQGAMEDAVRLLMFVLSAPDSEFTAEASKHLGIIKFKQADYETARQHLKNAIQDSHGETKAEAGYWLARTEMASENHTAAVHLIEAMSEVRLSEDIGSVMLFDGAVAATKINDDQSARRWLAQLRQQYPENHLADEALLLELNLTQRSGDHVRVIELATEFHAGFSDSAFAMEVAEIAGRSYYAVNDFENTVSTYQRLLSASIDEVQTAPMADEVREQRSKWLYLQSLGYLGLKQYDEALKELKLAEAYNQNTELATLIDLAFATAYFGSQQYSQAIPRYHSFLNHHDASQNETSQNDDAYSPEFVRAACEMTICFHELDQWQDARESFEIMKNCGDNDLVMQTTQYLAEQAYDDGQKELAGQFYEFMARPGNDQPVVSRALSGLAWVNMESTDPSATKFYQRLVAEYPDSAFAAKATMAHAQFLEDKNDVAGAQQTYALVVERFGDAPIANMARLRVANLLQKAGGDQNLAEAQTLLKDYLQSVVEKPAADEALYLLGWVMHDQGNSEQGTVRFQRLVDQHPNSKYWSDAAFRIAQQHIRDGNEDKADTLISAIIARGENAEGDHKRYGTHDVPQELLSRARYLKAQKAAAEKDWATVSTLMKKVVQGGESGIKTGAEPDNQNTVLQIRAQYWLAESLYQRQMFNEASQKFAFMTNLNGLDRALQPWTRLRMAQCLGKLQRWDDAGTVADDALHQFGDFENDYEFVFVSARSAEARGLFDDAEKLYGKVIESVNGSTSETAAIAQWRIGEMHFHKEQYKTAIEAYYRVDSLYDYPKWRAAAVLQAGKCQEHLGNWKHAAKLYTQILEKYPKSELAASAAERLQLVNRQAANPVPEKRR